jgi:5-methylcytosine-specific restriction endonuclease McrA
MITIILLAGALTLQTPDLTCRVRDKKGSLVRSRARVCLFLRMAGYVGKGEPCRVPEGMRADHLVPLACGGCDIPSNLTLLTIREHAAKSAWERKPCRAWWDGEYTRAIQAAVGNVP